MGQQNIIENINTNASNYLWVIGFDGGCCNYNHLSITITVPNINRIKLIGSGEIVVNDFSNQSNLDIDISGSGILTLNYF